MANKGKILLSNHVQAKATRGWPEFISIYQPAFEAKFDIVAKGLAKVDAVQGRTVTVISKDCLR